MLTRRGLARLIFGAAALATAGFNKVAEAIIPKTALEAVNQRRILLYIKNAVHQIVESHLFEPLSGVQCRINGEIHKFFSDLVLRGQIRKYVIEYDTLNHKSMRVWLQTNQLIEMTMMIGPFTSEPGE